MITNRVALVTGATSGIGLATALTFARRGIDVALADVNVDRGDKTVSQVEALGVTAFFRATDVSDADQVATLVDETVGKLGRLDYAVNSAGITGPSCAPAECSLQDWNQVLAVNLTGVFLCMKHEIRALLQTGGGAIVNIASVAGLIGSRGLPAYSASKAGVVGMTRAWALDYARHGIRINAVCPGAVDTPMMQGFADPDALARLARAQPMGRMAHPEEIAEAAVWLCCDGASFITGQALAVDGGIVVS